MFLVVLQHFVYKGGYQFTDGVGDFIYVGIDMFVMQAFFFLSGMFSKNPEKNRDHLFQTLLWPVVIVGIVFWFGVAWQYGLDDALTRFQQGTVPYAMWFLVALFIYRYFQKYYANLKHLLIIALVIYLISGAFAPLSMKGFAISRTCTFFISFVLGYMMNMDQIEKLRCLKWWQTGTLGAVLLGITYATITYLPENISIAIRLSSSYEHTHLFVWEGLLLRICLLIVSSAWIILLMNIFSNKKGFWAHVGMNTMPVYIFHLLFAGVFKLRGFTGGAYDFKGKEALYLAVLFAISLGITAILSTKPAQKLYNIVMDGSYTCAAKVMSKTIGVLLAKCEVKNDKSTITSTGRM